MRLKSLIIATVIRLQFRPFTWAFSLIYASAIKAAVFCVKKISGIEAIYLSGSFAGSAVIYGLSDIDFKIFVSGRKDKNKRDEIERVFKRLRRIFPMLGPADEKGIYFSDDFENDFTNYPLIRHLFDERFSQNKLLWGKDILPGFSLRSAADSRPYSSCAWKCKDWMERVITFCCEDKLAAVQKRYLLYKAIGGIGLICLKIKDPAYPSGDREAIFKDIKAFGSGKDALLISQLVQERRLFFKKSICGIDEAFQLFKRMLADCLRLIESRAAQENPRQCSIRAPKVDDSAITPRQINGIKAICHSQVNVTAYPLLCVPTNPLDCAYFGYPALVISPGTPLGLEELRGLRAFYKKELVDKAALLVKENDCYAYSVHSELMEHWLYSYASEDAAFILLQPLSCGAPDKKYLSLLKNKLFSYISRLDTIVNAPDLHKIDPCVYSKLLFLCLQNLILYRSLVSGGFTFLTGHQQITAYLKEHTPLSGSFIGLLQKESSFEAFFNKSKMFLRSFIEVIKNNEAFEKLAALNRIPDLQRLSISIVVITKTRPAQLKRNLDSFLALERQPDEVIVVDNGSGDQTEKIVSAFRGSLNIRYIREPAPNIAVVRNRGAQAASGEIIAFVDDDAIVEKHWLGSLEKPFLKDPAIGIVGGAIHNIESTRNDPVSRYFNILTKA